MNADVSPSPARRKLAKGCAITAALGALALAAFVSALHDPRPEPRSSASADADALARSMQVAVGADAWARTGAVRWTFAGQNAHLWDRARGLARVRSGDVEVLLHAGRPEGRAFRAGQPVTGPDADALVARAHAAWINDAYWLTAPLKAFDGGTTRELVDAPGGPQLLVSYASGGLTPGDAYLWRLDPTTGRPAAWRMWVSIIPVGGLEASWSGWTQLSTGAWVSTHHSVLGIPQPSLTDVAGAATLAELEPGPDPFAALISD